MDRTVFGGRRYPGALMAAVGALLLPGAVHAVDIQGVLPAAFDQPRINVAVEVNEEIRLVVGDFFMSMESAFLDTGASGILIGSEWTDLLSIAASEYNGQPVQFGDVGVGGTEYFDVSEVITLRLAPYAAEIDTATYDPLVYNQPVGPLRAQLGAPATDPFDPIQATLSRLNVIGMPAMAGKVVVMDPKPVNNAYLFFTGQIDLEDVGEMTMRTHLYDKPAQGQSNPLIPQTDRTIKLAYGTFDAYSTTTPAGAEGPTLSHNPFVGPAPVPEAGTDQSAAPMEFTYNGLTTTGSLLLDTGASLSAISTHLADDLGLTVEETINGPVIHGLAPGAQQLTATVMGVGGQKTIPGFYLDEMLIRTLEGTGLTGGIPDEMDINFVGAPIYILDIALAEFEGDPNPIVLDGLLGMNYFVASTWFEGGEFLDATISPWEMMVFDEVDGTLGLQLIPEPAAATVLVGLAGLLFRRRRVCLN